MNKNEHTAIMYESIPAVAELNKVPGFNPLKLLRRVHSPDSEETTLQLDLPYKKLWFRLANPKGRIKLNALRITEQLAIFEAQVYLERGDENPIGSFTSSCAKDEAPGGLYIQAAQQAAMNEALSDAGFGIQFADVNMDSKGSIYGSTIPLNKISQKENPPQPAVVETITQKEETLPVQAATEQSPSISSTLPVQSLEAKQPEQTAAKEELPLKEPEPKLPIPSKITAATVEETSNVLPITGKTAEKDNTQKAVQDVMALLGGQNLSTEKDTLPASGIQTQETPKSRFTPDMPVEEILKQMTFEEAGNVVVDVGVCEGMTLTEVTEQHTPSLKFYVYGGYRGDNNILRAAAKIMLDSLTAKKAG